jgi:hypothetical protein
MRLLRFAYPGNEDESVTASHAQYNCFNGTIEPAVVGSFSLPSGDLCPQAMLSAQAKKSSGTPFISAVPAVPENRQRLSRACQSDLLGSFKNRKPAIFDFSMMEHQNLLSNAAAILQRSLFDSLISCTYRDFASTFDPAAGYYFLMTDS